MVREAKGVLWTEPVLRSKLDEEERRKWRPMMKDESRRSQKVFRPSYRAIAGFYFGMFN